MEKEGRVGLTEDEDIIIRKRLLSWKSWIIKATDILKIRVYYFTTATLVTRTRLGVPSVPTLPALLIFMYMCRKLCGPGSSVGITTEYGLDGQGSNPGGDEIIRPSRPALGPNQSPVQWVPVLSRG